MILFVGPLYSGKTGCAEAYLREKGLDPAACRIRSDAQNLAKGCRTAEHLRAVADQLAVFDVILVTEVGSGLVPVDPDERAFRENAGRLSVLLAERAEEVYRVVCGIPTRLK